MNRFYRIILWLWLPTLITVASWQSLQRGIADYYLRKAEFTRFDDALLESALAHDPTNADIYERKGLRLYANGAFMEAFAEFDGAITRRHADYLLWLYRGRARSASGDLGGAESDYQTAVLLAPHYAGPQHEFGRFLLRTNRDAEAFLYLQRAASIDESLLPEVLDLAREKYSGDPLAIFRAVNPLNERVRNRTVLYLINNDLVSEDLASFVAQELDDQGSLEAVGELIERKKFHVAFEIWKAKHEASGTPADASNLLIAGDFESFCCERNASFGWQVQHEDSKIDIALSATGGFSDSRGLEIKFNGDADPSRLIIRQLVPVKTKYSYRLTFLSNGDRLVSGGLPIISIVDATNNNVIAESGPLGSPERVWNRSIMDFDIPVKTDGIIIEVRRSRCQSSPCPIFGELRLDNFVLTSHPAN